ncbi:MAG: site-specific DNA-methyltransferase [Bacteroidota bacterium]
MLNCELTYPNKLPKEEVLELSLAGKLHKLSANQATNQFYFGDNFPILQALRKSYEAKVDLIYIDPPFGTGQTFSNIKDEKAYEDPLPDYHFLEFLRHRLILLRRLLSPQGSMYLHIDKKLGHYVKLICDEVFGAENFINDISRIKCNPKNFARKAYGNFSDMILFYAKERDKNIWNEVREELSEGEIKKLFPKKEEYMGAYTTHPLHAPGKTLEGDTGKKWKGLSPPQGRHWRYGREVLDQLDASGLIEWSESGNPRKKVFAKDHKGKKIQDVWEFKDRGLSYVSYPTEKNRELLARIMAQSSKKNSYVLDAFAGSGSTLWVAEKMERKWIGIDQSPKSREIILQKLEDAKIDFEHWEWKS